MMSFQLKLSKTQVKALKNKLIYAQQSGNLQEIKRILAILSLGDGYNQKTISDILKVSVEIIRIWLIRFLTHGIKGLLNKKKPGRPPKLTKKQRRELYRLIELGPEALGYPGGCWRTPMIQDLIHERFKVFFNVRYISELLNSMGLSYQKAQFVAAKRDAKKRDHWLKNTWPEIIALSEKKKAMIMFGDEASFPQWGSLSYTWAPIGKTPTIETSGTRKGYKVFGLIDYYTGNFYAKGVETKLNGESYVDYLKEVLSKTRKHIILIQDGAPYHRSKVVKQFFEDRKDRLTVYTLPSYSPDYNPIEKLWKKIKQDGVHLKYFPTFEDLKSSVNNIIDIFKDCKNEVLSLFGFYEELAAVN